MPTVRGRLTCPYVCERVSAHRELRIARGRPEDVLTDAARDSPSPKRVEIENNCPELVLSAEYHMTRVDVAGPEPFEEVSRLARVEQDNGNARRLLRGQDCEEHGATAGQQLGKLVTLALFRDRQLMRLAAGGGRYPEAGAETTDDDPVAFSPGSTTERIVGMQPSGCAAVERSRPQFTARFEADSPAIISEEGIASTLSADDRFRIESVEIAPEQARPQPYMPEYTRVLPVGVSEKCTPDWWMRRFPSTVIDMTINGLDCSDGRARSPTVIVASNATSAPTSSQGASAQAERCRIRELLETTTRRLYFRLLNLDTDHRH